MDTVMLNEVRKETLELLERSGFPVSRQEIGELTFNDFGLGDFRKEGFTFIDILRSPRLRVTLIVLLPNQTLPQHVHPPDNVYRVRTCGAYSVACQLSESVQSGDMVPL